jgi:DNA primase
MTITQIDLAQIDLPALIERDGYPLRWQGGEWKGACPFCGGHERRAADRFRVQEKRADGGWLFACRKCGKNGDAITYRRDRHGETFAQACAALGVAHTEQRTAGPRKPTRPAFVPIERRAETWQAAAEAFALRCADVLWTPAGAKARAYLRGRGFTDDTLRAFVIGYNTASQRLAGQWWAWRGITIPRYYGGDLWAVNVRRHRADVEADSGDGKYRMLAGGTPGALFNADALITESQRGAIHTVIVTGGELDCMAAMQCAPAGVWAVTLGGETAKPDAEHVHVLRSYDVLVCLDNDATGEANAAKWLAALPVARRVHAPIGKDMNDTVRAGSDLRAWLAGNVRIDADTQRGDATAADMFARGYEMSVTPEGRYLAQHA